MVKDGKNGVVECLQGLQRWEHKQKRGKRGQLVVAQRKILERLDSSKVLRDSLQPVFVQVQFLEKPAFNNVPWDHSHLQAEKKGGKTQGIQRKGGVCVCDVQQWVSDSRFQKSKSGACWQGC